MLEAVCENKVNRLRELCTPDFLFFLNNGEEIQNLEDYINWLDNLHEKNAKIERTRK